MYQTLPDLSSYLGESSPNSGTVAPFRRSALQGLQRSQHLGTVFCRSYLLEDSPYASGLVDEECCPQHAFVCPAHESLLPPNSIYRAHAVADVCQQREWQAVLGLELRVRLNSVRTYSEEHYAGRPCRPNSRLERHMLPWCNPVCRPPGRNRGRRPGPCTRRAGA